jgi:hypothetical protein
MYRETERCGGFMRRYFCVVLLLFLYCTPENGSREKEKETIPPHDRGVISVEDIEFSTTGNPRFRFFFDHPKEWKPVDRSETGDGFFILTGDSSVDMRIYGKHRLLEDSEFYSTLLKENGRKEEFDFADGRRGIHITKDDTHYFIRNEEEVRILLYVRSNNEWYRMNENIILSIAKRIRMGGKE